MYVFEKLPQIYTIVTPKNMYFRLVCTKIRKVSRPIFCNFWKVHQIYTITKWQKIRSKCKFLDKISQIYIIMFPTNQIFSTCLYLSHNSILIYICNFLKNTSNLNYNDDAKSVKVYIIVALPQSYDIMIPKH